MKNKSTKPDILIYSKDDIVHFAILQNEAILKRNFPNIHFIHEIVEKKTKDKVVGVFLYDKKDSKIPSKVPVHLPDGTKYTVKILVVKGLGDARAHFANGKTAALCLSSATNYTGSACCILQDPLDDTKNYILTSCHVLTEEDLTSPLYNTDNEEVNYDDVVVGTWTFGCMNKFGDYATVLLNEDFDTTNSGLTYPKGTRDINEAVDMNGVFHIKSQFNDGSKNAFFHGLARNKVSIGYSLGHSQVYDCIMLLSNSADISTGKTLTQGGDSGGAVYDANNSIVGIIVGGDNVFSYAIPVKSLINGLKLKTL